MALKDDQKEKENKRHTMSHPPDHIPELDSPRQSRSPIKKDKKERVSPSAVTLSSHTFPFLVIGKMKLLSFSREFFIFSKSKFFFLRFR